MNRGSDESGTEEIYVQSFSLPPTSGSLENGPKMLVSRGGGTSPRWRADGRELFYSAPDGNVMSIAIHSTSPFRPGVPKSLFKMAGQGWDVSGDGTRLLVFPATLASRWMPGLFPDKADSDD